jgi:hypothetical protein
VKEIKNNADSVHDRLQNLARIQNRPFAEILQYYGIERFLFRLLQTEYRHKFVLKGGLVFYALGLPLRRPTRDIDFRGFVQNSIDNLIEIIKITCSISVPNDGLVYREETIQIEETMENADYKGLRITFEALLGTARIPMRVDIGFSDVITPEIQNLIYPVLLEGMDPLMLSGYPPETIISEKFQAMVRLVEINSRWKDFYDIWMLSELMDFRGEVLQRAISATFHQRATNIPSTIPALTDDFARERQKQWGIFLTRNKIEQDRNKSFVVVVNQLRLFLLPVLQAIADNAVFDKNWIAGSGWF